MFLYSSNSNSFVEDCRPRLGPGWLPSPGETRVVDVEVAAGFEPEEEMRDAVPDFADEDGARLGAALPATRGAWPPMPGEMTREEGRFGRRGGTNS